MRRSNERGAVAVEFALLVPLMVIILFAIIEFGIALMHSQAYYAAAREGARFAAVGCRPPSSATGCTAAAIQDWITDAVPAMPSGYEISFSGFSVTNMDCDPAGELVSITWSQNVPIDMPFLGDMSWTLHPTGAFRCE